ncbi:hypothetical protein [Metabacillus sp. 84]|uniref:hypothetical protein n=1 Tax=Metabacillus sp. 84 TaxID=3404705 RepID=UPI003CEF2A45
MKNVMVKAWEIARKGQKQFGGKIKEYFAQALQMAWNIVKKEMTKTNFPQTFNKIEKAAEKQAKEFFAEYLNTMKARNVEVEVTSYRTATLVANGKKVKVEYDFGQSGRPAGSARDRIPYYFRVDLYNDKEQRSTAFGKDMNFLIADYQ